MSTALTTQQQPAKRKGGKRSGAGHPFKPLNENGQAAAKRVHPAFNSILERNRTRSMTQEQAVFQLFVNEGKSFIEISDELDLCLSSVSKAWTRVKQDLAANAPKSPEEMSSMRELINARLEATIRATYPKPEVLPDIDMETGQNITIQPPANASMMAIRLKALDQQAKLYGVNMEQAVLLNDAAPYKTPDEIAETVRAHLLTMHGRESFLTPSPATGAGGTSESASSRPETEPP